MRRIARSLGVAYSTARDWLVRMRERGLGPRWGLAYPGIDIPGWVMTELGVLVAKGDVTVDEFKTALTYVLDNA